MNYVNLLWQKMNYLNYLHFSLYCFFRFVSMFGIVSNVFLYFWSALYYKLLILMRLSNSVYFSVYMNIFQRYVFTIFEKCPEVWTIFVRTIFWDVFCFGGIGGVLNGPPTPTHTHTHTSPASMSKFPSGGNNYGKWWFCNDVLCFLWQKIKKMLLKRSRRVAFVGWDVAGASLERRVQTGRLEINANHKAEKPRGTAWGISGDELHACDVQRDRLLTCLLLLFSIIIFGWFSAFTLDGQYMYWYMNI